MWVKLGSDYLNLDHVVRVRFNKGWKNGNEEIIAEVEGLVKGEVQVFTRYRNQDAEALQAVLATQTNADDLVLAPLLGDEPAAANDLSSSTTNTLHDM